MTRDTRAERAMLYLVYFIYFFCGLTTCFEGVFLPEFKEYFHLSYQQQMYTMFAKNIPALLAVVIGLLIVRIGYKNCLTIAMVLFSAGTLLLVPGLRSGRYGIVLLGFFLIGTGFAFQITSGNPLLCAAGNVEGASSRLNLGNALGAVAQIIAPATLSFIIPATVVTVTGKLPYMEALFVALAAVLAGTAGIAAMAKRVAVEEKLASDSAGAEKAWLTPRLMAGFIAIVLVLGFEAALFALYRNFLEEPAIAGVSSHVSQPLFTLYFALFAAGRLGGAWIQKRISPSTHLLVSLAGSFACLTVLLAAKGWVAIAAVTAIGFFISIFYPTLYALAIEGMGAKTGPASGLLTMAFLGSAILPVLQGHLADSVGLQRSYALGFVAYAFALVYVIAVSYAGRKRISASAVVSR